MVDTNDEWIMTRIGVKERRILNEEGLGTSYMARKAAKQLMKKRVRILMILIWLSLQLLLLTIISPQQLLFFVINSD